MTVERLTGQERQRWGGALGLAAGGHVLAALGVLALVRPMEPPLPDPVMLVELPSLPPPAQSASVQEQVPVETPDVPQPVVKQPLPPIEAPRLNIPVPADAVTVPVKPAQAAPAPAPVAAPIAQPQPMPSPASPSIGDDPKARKAEADYFAILSAYLRRNKVYPAEAKQARQQGIVTIRFTVDRRGNVSGESVKRSSGHTILDSATIQMLRRVSPLPSMPSSLKRDSVTISLPIEYSLTTK